MANTHQIFTVEQIEHTIRYKIEQTQKEFEATPSDDKRMKIALKGEIRGMEYALELCVRSRTAARGY